MELTASHAATSLTSTSINDAARKASGGAQTDAPATTESTKTDSAAVDNSSEPAKAAASSDLVDHVRKLSFRDRAVLNIA